MDVIDTKDGVRTSAQEDRSKMEIDQTAQSTSRSHYDADDMLRLGKKQLYTRNFRLFATIGFATIYSSTWEFVLVSSLSGLINGGFGGLFAQFIWTMFGSLMVCMSLAEMSSMAPTAGGQYHCEKSSGLSVYSILIPTQGLPNLHLQDIKSCSAMSPVGQVCSDGNLH